MTNKNVTLSSIKIELYQVYSEMFKRGNYDFITVIKGKKHLKQEGALKTLADKDTREILYGGSAGSAKSWTGSAWLLFSALAYPGTKWFIGRESLKRLRDSTLLTFYKVCKAYEVPKSEYKYNGQDNYIQFANGSRIDMLDLRYLPSDPLYERYGSVEYTGGWLEEGGEVNFGSFDTLKTRVGRHMNDIYGLVPKIFVTCNPKKNWMYGYFYKPFVAKTLKKVQTFIQAFISDNPFIEKDYLEQLQSTTDKAKRERLLYGNWEYDDNPYKLVIYDRLLEMWTNDHIYRGNDYFLTCDVARFGSDKAVIGVWKGWELLEVIEFAISSTSEIQWAIRRMIEKYRIPKRNCIADSDGVGCLDNNMEVLTTLGWKKAIDITLKDYIVSKNKDGVREVLNAYEILHHKNERFIKINDDLAFTSCHTHFYKTRKEHGFKSDYWDNVCEKSRIYHDDFVKTDKKSNNFVFEATQYGMPNGGSSKFSNELNIDANSFYKFIGWFLSEGYLDSWNNKNVIGITQTVKSIHNDDIVAILNSMGVNYIAKIQKKGTLIQYQFQHKALFNWLKENCYVDSVKNCYNKQFPTSLKETERENIISFCEEFIKGDGYFHKGKMQFISSSKKLIDDIQEILLYSGVRSRIFIKHKKGSKGNILGREITRTVDSYLLSEISDIPTTKIIKKETYLGQAVEIKIPNETRALLVRHGNKVFWTHNGGVVDSLGILGFVNNARAFPEVVSEKYKDVPKYKNMQVQLLVYLAEEIINKNKIFISAELSSDQKEAIKEELDTIERIPDLDTVTLTGKEQIKQDLGRSPDYRDMIFMRAYFDFNQKSGVTASQLAKMF